MSIKPCLQISLSSATVNVTAFIPSKYIFYSKSSVLFMTANFVSFIMLLCHLFLWMAFLRRLEIKLPLPSGAEF